MASHLLRRLSTGSRRLASIASSTDSGFLDQLNVEEDWEESVVLSAFRRVDEDLKRGSVSHAIIGDPQQQQRGHGDSRRSSINSFDLQNSSSSAAPSSLPSVAEDDVFEHAPLSAPGEEMDEQVWSPNSHPRCGSFRASRTFDEAALATCDGEVGLLHCIVRGRDVHLDRDHDANGWSLMHFACMANRHEVVAFLLSQGVNALRRDINGRSSLHICAIHDSHRCLKLILDCVKEGGDRDKMKARDILEAEVQRPDCNGDTPVHFASRHHSECSVKLLLDCLPTHSTVLLAVNARGQTPLHVAASRARVRPMRALFNSRSGYGNVWRFGKEDRRCKEGREWKDGEGDTVLTAVVKAKGSRDQAVDDDAIACVRLLLRKCPRLRYMRDKAGLTPLMVAAVCGRPSMIKELVKRHALHVDDLDSNYRTALHHAAARGRLSIVAQLLALGANPALVDRLGVAPVYYAAGRGFGDIVLCLNAAGTTVPRNLQLTGTAQPYTPLMWAAAGGHARCVARMLQAIPPHARSKSEKTAGAGQTAMHLAARLGHGEVVKTLVEYQWDIEEKDDAGCSPLFLAAVNGHSDTVAVILKTCGASMMAGDEWNFTVLHLAASRSDLLDVLHVLVASPGAILDCVDVYGRTPLFCAIDSSAHESARVLLQCGASPMIADNRFWTPLHVAASQDDTRSVTMLLEHGAPVNAYSPIDRCTPLSLAFSGRLYVNDIIIDLLGNHRAILPEQVRQIAATRIQRWYRFHRSIRRNQWYPVLRRCRMNSVGRLEKYPYSRRIAAV